MSDTMMMAPKKPREHESMQEILGVVEKRGETVPVSLRLTAEVLGDIDKLAARMNTTRTQIIEKTLQWALPALRDAAEKESK